MTTLAPESLILFYIYMYLSLCIPLFHPSFLPLMLDITSQALVNLVLTGRACNEVHEDAWSNWQGIPRLGFLTLEKNYHPALPFRSPVYPLWVVHGTVARAASWRQAMLPY